jgi:hypothetical protein
MCVWKMPKLQAEEILAHFLPRQKLIAAKKEAFYDGGDLEHIHFLTKRVIENFSSFHSPPKEEK